MAQSAIFDWIVIFLQIVKYLCGLEKSFWMLLIYIYVNIYIYTNINIYLYLSISIYKYICIVRSFLLITSLWQGVGQLWPQQEISKSKSVAFADRKLRKGQWGTGKQEISATKLRKGQHPRCELALRRSKPDARWEVERTLLLNEFWTLNLKGA